MKNKTVILILSVLAVAMWTAAVINFCLGRRADGVLRRADGLRALACGAVGSHGGREAQGGRRTVSTKPEKSAHFAAYPKELIEPCVLAGCSNGGVVLDPFMGTGTTAMVARMYGRNFIGFELNAEYMSIINKKIQVTPNIFYL